MGEKLWRKNLINIEPYVAGEQPKNDKIIKLNANENPYPPSPKVKAILEGKTIAELRKYPSADASALRAALAERVGLKSENVFCGNGSDDVLATAFRAFFNSDKPILYPDITYSFYPVWCELLKIPYKTKSVDENFVINIEDFKEPNGGVVIPNPNAPTSLGVGEKFIRELLENNQDSIVIIDEAYVDFGRYSCVELIIWHSDHSAVRAMYYRDRLAPISLTIESPVFHLILNALFTAAHFFKNSKHLFDSFFLVCYAVKLT